MKNLENKARSSALTRIPVLFLSFLILASIAVYAQYLEIKRDFSRTESLAQIQAARLQNVIDGQLYAAKTAEILLIQGQGVIDNFDGTMKEIIGDQHIHNISIAPGGVITQTYPLRGNEQTIGHDVLNDPARSAESLEAKRSGKLTVSGPYELRQGGIGIIGRQPVYMGKDAGADVFWGFVNVTLMFPEAFEDAQFDNLIQEGYHYQLWRADHGSGGKQKIIGCDDKLYGKLVEYSFELPNSEWTLSMIPQKGWLDYRGFALKVLFVILVLFLIFLLRRFIVRLEKSRDELDIAIRQQTENYRQMNQMNARTRAFKHDISNHMISLTGLLKADRKDEAVEYIENISDTFLSSSVIFNTENYIFDALLAKKRTIAEEKHIAMDCEILVDRKLHMDSIDWSILYGNLLDNAIEAAENTEKPYVRISMSCKGNILHTKVTNTAKEAPIVKKGIFETTKQDKGSHGLGMSHIRKIVEKYEGSLETKYEDGVFSISFLLINV